MPHALVIRNLSGKGLSCCCVARGTARVQSGFLHSARPLVCSDMPAYPAGSAAPPAQTCTNVQEAQKLYESCGRCHSQGDGTSELQPSPVARVQSVQNRLRLLAQFKHATDVNATDPNASLSSCQSLLSEARAPYHVLLHSCNSSMGSTSSLPAARRDSCLQSLDLPTANRVALDDAMGLTWFSISHRSGSLQTRQR
jgi:hypothetical protein